jgi:hypothetical protein
LKIRERQKMMTEDDRTDLSNFGGGVDNTKVDDPEDKDNLSLSKWLTNPSVNVYWDREKPYGYSTFSVTTQRRPDLIIDAKVNTFAVEVKDYEKTGCVINGAEQAEGYWRDIESGKAEYSINGNRVEIDAVLLATRASKAGHLFEDIGNRDPRRSTRDRSGTEWAKTGNGPTIEHTASEVCIRTMYRFARRWFDESEHTTASTGIGVLYSSVLDSEDPNAHSVPAAYYIVPGSGRKSNNWDYIPFYKHGH